MPRVDGDAAWSGTSVACTWDSPREGIERVHAWLKSGLSTVAKEGLAHAGGRRRGADAHHRLRGRPGLRAAAGHHPRRLQGSRRLEGGAAEGRCHPRRLVGDLRRSSAERARAASEHLEPELGRGGGDVPAGARWCERPSQLLSYGEARSQLYTRFRNSATVGRSSAGTSSAGASIGGGSSSPQSDFQLGLDFSWELDPGVRRTVESNLASAQASAGDLESARLSPSRTGETTSAAHPRCPEAAAGRNRRGLSRKHLS